MARGIDGSRRRRSPHLTTSSRWRPQGAASLTLAAVSLLAACGGSSAPPTLQPAPTLPVVTATAGPPPVPTPGERQRYIVQEGDTLSGIAARFGVSEEAILEENPLSDPNRLLVGQELVIPPAQP